jgi:hypothetical protein
MRTGRGNCGGKGEGVKFGRPQVPLPDNFYEVYTLWRDKKLTLKEARTKELCYQGFFCVWFFDYDDGDCYFGEVRAGVSPVSLIPHTITCVFGIEMGKATILFHAILVMAQYTRRICKKICDKACIRVHIFLQIHLADTLRLGNTQYFQG